MYDIGFHAPPINLGDIPCIAGPYVPLRTVEGQSCSGICHNFIGREMLEASLIESKVKPTPSAEQ